jgi:hypothetical protein
MSVWADAQDGRRSRERSNDKGHQSLGGNLSRVLLKRIRFADCRFMSRAADGSNRMKREREGREGKGGKGRER